MKIASLYTQKKIKYVFIYIFRGSTDGSNSPTSLSKSLSQVILTVFAEKKSTCDDPKKYCAYKRASKNSNVCWHDLGAPLMFFDDSKWYVYGITSSFGVDPLTKQCTPSSPSYYTIVPNYLGWIGYNLEILNDTDEKENNTVKVKRHSVIEELLFPKTDLTNTNLAQK